MAKQIINIGTGPNTGTADSLRVAFEKVNSNFTELYNTATADLQLPDQTNNAGKFLRTDGTDLSWVTILGDGTPVNADWDATTGLAEILNKPTIPADVSDLTDTTNLLSGGIDLSAVAQNIVPSVDSDGTTGYTLGSPTFKWKELFVSNGSIYIGDIKLSNVGGKLSARKVRNPGEENEEEDPEDSEADSEIKAINKLVNDDHEFALTSDGTLTLDGELFTGSGGTTLPSQSGQEGKFLRTDGEDLSWVTVTGGEGGTSQPYLELTNTPFITQSVTLDTPVTAIADLRGQDALVEVVIGEGPVIESITITTPGVLYVVGQRYRINYWQVGGNSDDGNIDFEVATVGDSGALLTIANAAFAGPAQVNTGTYSNTSIEYRPTEFDEVDTGLTLTRGLYGGLFNAEEEFSYNSSVSPIGALWNAEGWSTLVGFNTRTYETFNSILTGPDNTPPGELIMWDTINNKYYKFAINIWGIDNNEFSYTRTLITDPNYFRKTDGLVEGEVDVIVEDDGEGAGIGITRGENGGIYNPYRDEGWSSSVSPSGTQWNIDGWDDLTDIESRTYTNFYAAYGNGQLGNRVPGSKAIMYVPEIDKYYAVEWLGWTQLGNYGGFSYTRREIDLTKLTQGITFADGTVQTTAYVDTNVVSTAVGDRRIETASGYKEVSVTQRVTNTYTGTLARTTNAYEVFINRTFELQQVIAPIWDGEVTAEIEISLDGGVTYTPTSLVSLQETEIWFSSNSPVPIPQVADDVVYLRISTGGDSVVWWNKTELPGGAGDFRGAVIDYHAFTGSGTIIGTIHIVDDDGEEYITHTEVSSGSNSSMNDNLWIVTSEGQIRYARFDLEAKTLKIHWTAKVFYGSELYD